MTAKLAVRCELQVEFDLDALSLLYAEVHAQNVMAGDDIRLHATLDVVRIRALIDEGERKWASMTTNEKKTWLIVQDWEGIKHFAKMNPRNETWEQWWNRETGGHDW